MKLKKTLGYFHHREQNMLHQISKTIVEILPDCIVFLLDSNIKHDLSRDIFSKPQRLERWIHNYNLLLIHEDSVSIDEKFKEVINALHTDIESVSIQARAHSTFIKSLNEEDLECNWIYSKAIMLYGSENLIVQLPNRKKFHQEEEEKSWFQFLSKGIGNNMLDN